MGPWYRRVAGDALLSWEGDTDIDPPIAAKRGQLRLEGDWSAKGIRDQHARLVRPDAVPELEDREDQRRTFLIEYDRTRRVDKNVGKFRRYDAFLNWWWAETTYGRTGRAAVRSVRLPERRTAAGLPGSRRPRAHRAPLASEHPPRPARVRRTAAHAVRRRTRYAPGPRRRMAIARGATRAPSARVRGSACEPRVTRRKRSRVAGRPTPGVGGREVRAKGARKWQSRAQSWSTRRAVQNDPVRKEQG
jgi:hypothetical protein